jgi:hypothetical protein
MNKSGNLVSPEASPTAFRPQNRHHAKSLVTRHLARIVHG